jgi:hypothetical protein
LLGPDIEGADLYTILAGKLRDLSIRFVLLVLSWKSFESIEVKLGPVKSDPGCADPFCAFLDLR